MKVAKSPRAREGGASIDDRWAHENGKIGQGGNIASSRWQRRTVGIDMRISVDHARML